MIKELVISVRPKQWYKNLVVFAGLVFSFNLLNVSMLLNTILAFAIFCAISGSVYIFNDIHDREADREHPKKSKRPVASGRLGLVTAGFFGILMLVVSLVLAFTLLNLLFFAICITYFILIDIYTYWLKKIALVDVMAISIGFVLRAIAGVVAIMVTLSPWLILVTLLLAMFLAFGKRKNELMTLGDESGKHRSSLNLYSHEMLDNFITISASLIIISYSFYTFLASSSWMMLTIPFVIFAVYKYMQLLNLKMLGGETEMVFKNKAMVINMILWLIFILLILYDIPPIILELLITL
jgi:4-hydroxybenzoate polyprenyltransferase